MAVSAALLGDGRVADQQHQHAIGQAQAAVQLLVCWRLHNGHLITRPDSSAWQLGCQGHSPWHHHGGCCRLQASPPDQPCPPLTGSFQRVQAADRWPPSARGGHRVLQVANLIHLCSAIESCWIGLTRRHWTFDVRLLATHSTGRGRGFDFHSAILAASQTAQRQLNTEGCDRCATLHKCK